MASIVDKLKNINPFALVSLVFLLSVVFVNPVGEFAVNDDWIFVRQVESFSFGDFRISAILDPSFIVQGLMGLFWSSIFGVSFTSLRLLTVLTTLFMLFGIYEILKFFDSSKKLIFITLFLTVFNPLVFTSSLTFMTEIYFLLFFVWSIHFYLKGNNIWGSFFTALSILVRQVGIVTFIAYLIIEILFSKKRKVKKFDIIASSALVILSIITLIYWPRYGEGGVFSNFIEPQSLPKRIRLMFFSLIYFVYFLLPLIFLFKHELRKKLVYTVPFYAILTLLIYKIDIFAVGSVFYVEALHAKSNFRSNLSIFDNIIFKLLISFAISVGFVRLAYLLKETKRRLDRTTTFLVLVSIGMFTVLIFGNDFYDRYLLPSLIGLLFLAVYCFNKRKSINYNFFVAISLVVIFVASLLLQHEFFTHTKIRWVQARAIQKDTGYVTNISVDGTYAKYFNAAQKEDYTGLIRTAPTSSYVCYVQKYTVDSDAISLAIFEGVDNSLQKLIQNPRIYESRKKTGFPRAKNNLDKLIYNEEYFSPIYNLVGKKAYVGSWCSNE